MNPHDIAVQHCPRVAVYGTLKRGHRNHHLLQEARFLGSATLNGIALHDLGPYPGAIRDTASQAVVEIFEINAATLKQLDALEGYLVAAPQEGLYDRAVFTTRHGSAWCYLYNGSVASAVAIASGEW